MSPISASTVGSIALAPAYSFMPAPAYKLSQAAVHPLTVQYSLDYEKQNFAFIAISPGVSGNWILLIEKGAVLKHRGSG
jgi:NAD(P)-dependent dehydrogenase (short-subunit alcohol dehydrogenase family)